MKPMKNLLLMGLLSALGAGGALAAERSHFTHFITRDGATLKDGDKVFRFAGIHAPELHRIEDDARGSCRADPRGWGQYFKWPTAQSSKTDPGDGANRGESPARLRAVGAAGI